MLVLNRRDKEVIVIGEGPDAIEVAFLGMSTKYRGQARIGIKAPASVLICRQELLDTKKEQQYKKDLGE